MVSFHTPLELEDLVRLAEEQGPGLGDDHAAAAFSEELHAQRVFQAFDMRGHRGLAHVQVAWPRWRSSASSLPRGTRGAG